MQSAIQARTGRQESSFKSVENPKRPPAPTRQPVLVMMYHQSFRRRCQIVVTKDPLYGEGANGQQSLFQRVQKALLQRLAYCVPCLVSGFPDLPSGTFKFRSLAFFDLFGFGCSACLCPSSSSASVFVHAKH